MPRKKIRVRIETDFCQGHEVCCNEAPDVFALEDGKAHLLIERPETGLYESVRLAAQYCPTRAIKIEEE